MSRFKENIIAFGWALVIALVIVFVLNGQGDQLKADLMQWWADDSIDSNIEMSDMDIVMSGADLLVKSNLEFENISTASIEVMYDPEKVSVSRDSVDSIYEVSLAPKEWDSWYDIILQNIWVIRKWENLFVIKDVWEENIKYINLWQIILFDTNGISILLSHKKE